MRPSSQEAYASSWPKMLAAPAAAQAPQVPGGEGHIGIGCAGPEGGGAGLVGLAQLLVPRATLAQRRHKLLEMRVSWMLIHKK